MKLVLDLKKNNMEYNEIEKAFEKWHQSSQKFDYYITGFTGGLCAYIAQSYKATPVSISPNTLELISLLVIIASVVAGFKRIESQISIENLLAKLAFTKGEIEKYCQDPGDLGLLNQTTGKVVNPEVVKINLESLRNSRTKIDSKLQNSGDNWELWYSIRNWSLLCGFLLLVASKVWYAYV